jgi:alkylation response protein AidB-like acyl-CoA dehydrogenase
MHQFARTDEQRLLSENLARLLAQTNAFEQRRRHPDRRADGSALWSALADLGIIGAAFEESRGGFGGDARTIAVVMAELGVGLALAPYLECAIVAGRILQQCTDEATSRAALDTIIGGRSIYLLAHAVHDPSTFAAVSVTQRGAGLVLCGSVQCVRHAALAEAFLVPAIAQDGATHIYQVFANSPGLVLESYRLIDGGRAADLHFRETTIAANARLPLADPRAVLQDAFEWGVLASVAEASGILGALNSATFSYLMTRKQFGVVIGSFQALQHRAADMHIAAEETLAIADAAIESFAGESTPARSVLVSAAKTIADGAARRIGAEAVQLHGAMGVSDELIVSHYARRLVAIRHTLGSTDAHRLRFGTMQ